MKEIGIFDLSNELVSQNTIVNSHIVAHNKMVLNTVKFDIHSSIVETFTDLVTSRMFYLIESFYLKKI